jgi:hypothetical protein
MSQPPQGGQPPQGPDDSVPHGTNPGQGPGPQAYPPQPGPPAQPPYPPQGYPQQGYPPQGYPQQGYPPQGRPQQGPPPPYGGPGAPAGGYGLPPGGPQPYQPGPYQPSPTQPGQQPGKKRTGLFVLIGAGLLALVLVVVAVAVRGGTDEGAGSSPAGTSSTGAPPAAAKASDAVQGFLEAVAANDAARALGFVDQAPEDTALLTDAVLQASSAQAPLGSISVPEVSDQYAYKVPATFSLGGKSYSRDFDVKDSGNGWKVSNGVTKVDVSYQRQETLPMIVNGVKVTSDELLVVPGTYTFTSGSKWVSWGTSNKVTFADEYPTLPFKIKPTLTKAGRDTVLAQTKSAFKRCLAQHKLRPKGCPNRINDTLGIKVKESTVRWRVTKDPFRNAKIDLDSSDPTSATGSFYPDYRIKFRGTKGGVTGTVDTDVIGLTSFETVADLSKAKVTVKIG